MGKLVPESFTTQVANGTTLSEILRLAALSNKEGPYNRYTTTFYAGLGNMVVALNGVEQDATKNLYWIIYDEGTGQRIPVSIDIYQPVDMSTTLFNFEKVEGSCQE